MVNLIRLSRRAGRRNRRLKLLALPAIMAGLRLPFSIDFSTLPDGALPSFGYGPGWAVSSGAAVNTPTEQELVANGSFAAWTGGNPDDWTIFAEDANNYVEESPAGVAHVVSNTDNLQFYTSVGAVANKWVRYGIQVVDASGPSLWYRIMSETTIIKDLTTAEILNADRWVASNAGTTYGFTVKNQPVDMQVDNVSLILLTDLTWLVKPTQANATVKAGWTIAANRQAGVIGRADKIDDPANYLAGIYSQVAARVELHKVVNGVNTTIATAAAAYSAGALVELRMSGTTVEVWYNNVQKISQTVDEATINNNRNHGLISTSGGNTADSFFCIPPA